MRSQSLLGEALCWSATQVLAKAQKPLEVFQPEEGFFLRERAEEGVRAIAEMNGDKIAQSARWLS